MSEIKTLYRQSSHYLLGRVAVMALGFISFPLYTRLLSVANYGIVTLAMRLMLFPVAAAKLGLQTALLRFYEESSTSPSALPRLYSTIFFGVCLCSAAATVLYMTSIGALRRGVVSTPIASALLAASGLVFVRGVMSIVQGVLRVEQRTVAYNAMDVAGRIATISVVVVLLFGWRRSPEAVLLGTTAAEAITVLAACWLLLPSGHFSWRYLDPPLLRRCLAYGAPLALSELATVLLGSSDRVLVQYYLGAEQLGYYSAALGLALYMEEAIQLPLSLALVPIYMRMWVREGPERTGRFLQQALRYFTWVAAGVTAMAATTSQSLIVVLSSAKFEPAHPFLAPLAVAYFVYAANIFANAGLLIHKKTGALARCALACAVLKIALNIILLPHFGLWGAVAATLVTHVTLIASMLWISSRLLPLSAWKLGLGKAVPTAALCTWIVSPLAFGPPWTNLLLKGVLTAGLYGLLMVLLDTELQHLARRALATARTRMGKKTAS